MLRPTPEEHLAMCDFCQVQVSKPIPVTAAQRDVMLRAYNYRELPGLGRARKGKGWTITALARSVDVSTEYLWRIEKCVHGTRNVLVRRLADVLEVPVSELEQE